MKIEKIDSGTCHLYITALDPGVAQRREAEREAVERLVCYVFGDSGRVGHRDTGAPYIKGADVYISISHSRSVACLAVADDGVPGVDVEEPREQLRRVAPRVLSDDEMAVYGRGMPLLLRAWTLKEALYKAALTPGLDFRRDIALPLDLDDMTARVGERLFDILLIDTTDERTVALVKSR